VNSPRAAYVHVPFCRHRCGYCNFTLIAGRDDLIDKYLRAIEIELGWLEQPRPVATLFLGGGTPTHLDDRQLAHLLQTVTHWFRLPPGGEFTVEANPSDITPSKVQVLVNAGVNRVSLGAQSWDATKLSVLERDHGPEMIERALELLRPHVRSLSIDLIFAAPGETADVWQHDLQRTIAAAPEHISTYGMTYERGAAFWSRRRKQQLAPVDELLERSMYEAAIDQLTSAGWQHYEVSNFARPNHRCRHNDTYWLGEEYYAAGPGAARYVNGCREMNHRSTTAYVQRVLRQASPVAESERLSPEDRARERLVFGLRRMEGVDLHWFEKVTGFAVDELVRRPLARFQQLGLLERTSDRLRLTRAGLMISDALWPEFLCGDEKERGGG
jgi:oxygen-independent coproporphyrinogen-3 oxidase